MMTLISIRHLAVISVSLILTTVCSVNASAVIIVKIFRDIFYDVGM